MISVKAMILLLHRNSCTCILIDNLQKCNYMTFVIGILNNIILLHTKMQNYHLKYLNVIMQIRKLFILTNNIITGISGRGTLRTLDI